MITDPFRRIFCRMLLCQWADAIHFEGVDKDITLWADDQGRTSWMGRFVDYLHSIIGWLPVFPGSRLLGQFLPWHRNSRGAARDSGRSLAALRDQLVDLEIEDVGAATPPSLGHAGQSEWRLAPRSRSGQPHLGSKNPEQAYGVRRKPWKAPLVSM